MTPSPSPEEIEARIAELDAIAKDDYASFGEWEPEAMERLILHLWTVHYAMCSGLWGKAMEGLVQAANMCQKIGENVVAEVPRDQLIEMLRNKLELMAQHPMAVAHDLGGVVAFRFDHPQVPDTLENL